MSGAPVFGGRYADLLFDRDRRVVAVLVEMPIRMAGPILDRLGPPPKAGEGPFVLLHWVCDGATSLTGLIEAAIAAHVQGRVSSDLDGMTVTVAGVPAAADAVLDALGLKPPPRLPVTIVEEQG